MIRKWFDDLSDILYDRNDEGVELSGMDAVVFLVVVVLVLIYIIRYT